VVQVDTYMKAVVVACDGTTKLFDDLVAARAAKASLRGSNRTSECVRVASILVAIAARAAVQMGEKGWLHNSSQYMSHPAWWEALHAVVGKGVWCIRNGIPTFTVGHIGMLCC
jgi:hypothetical protein